MVNITKYSDKFFSLVKKFTSQQKRFFAHGNGKVKVPLQYFALRISAFFALAQQRLWVKKECQSHPNQADTPVQ